MTRHSEMNITPKCILRLKQNYPEFTGKSKVIADYILESPEKVVTQKVREIAQACDCDDALVIRFCKKIGYSGFSAFKMSLATEFLPVRLDLTDNEFSPGDSFSQLKRNFLENNVKALSDSIGLLKIEDVNRAIELLFDAKKIYLLAFGASGIVASDIHLKLMQLGFNAVFTQDVEFAKILTVLSDKEDVLLAISYTGETAAVCDIATAVKKRGVPVISVTNFPKSSLSAMSDVALLTASDEKVFRLGAMTSRMAQYFLLDFLIVNLALQDMERFEETIFKKFELLKPKKYKGPENA